MRFILLLILVFALTVPAFADEIELLLDGVNKTNGVSTTISSFSPVFAGKGEQELINDSGSIPDYGACWTALKSCNTITAPYDCWLISVKFFVNCDDSQGGIAIDVFEDSGVGSKPSVPPTSCIGGSINWDNTGEDKTWQVVDLSSPVFLANGTIVHPGQENGLGGSCGIYADDNNTGTLGWWVWSSYQNDWVDSTDNAYSGGHYMARLIVNDDADSPVAAAQDPADGDTGVSITTDILFDIDDADIGVDSGTIVDGSVTVDQDIPTKGKIDVPGLLTYDDTDPNNVHVTFNPDSDFEEGAIVTVTVSPAGTKITDDLGNEMAEDTWSFTVFSSGVEAASLGEIKANFK